MWRVLVWHHNCGLRQSRSKLILVVWLQRFLHHPCVIVSSLLILCPIQKKDKISCLYIWKEISGLKSKNNTYLDHESTSEDLLVFVYELGFFHPVFSKGNSTEIALPFFIITWEHVWTLAALNKGADVSFLIFCKASISCNDLLNVLSWPGDDCYSFKGTYDLDL